MELKESKANTVSWRSHIGRLPPIGRDSEDFSSGHGYFGDKHLVLNLNSFGDCHERVGLRQPLVSFREFLVVSLEIVPRLKGFSGALLRSRYCRDDKTHGGHRSATIGRGLIRTDGRENLSKNVTNTFGDGFFKGFDLLLLARLDRRIAQCLDGLVDIAIKVTFGRDNLSKNMDILILRQSVWFFGVICSITFLDVFEPDTIYQTPPLPEFKPENT